MMTVKEMHARLEEALREGKADWPIQILEVASHGVPYAVDVDIHEAAFSDGERFWLIVDTDPHPPEWAQSARPQ